MNTRRFPMMMGLVTAALLSASIGEPVEVEATPPLPPSPDDPPPLPPTTKARGRHGRSGGTQPVPRAFYSGRLLPGEDPSLNTSFMVDEFNFAQQVARDKAALLAAEEKRARKARKRLGK